MIAAVMAVATACREATRPRGWAGTMDTLENGVVLVNNPARGLWDEVSAWRLVEDLRIGAIEGAGPAVFGQINDVEVDRAGRIYVLDRLAQEIRIFDPSGAYVRTIGRQGEGPGEFRTAHGLEFGPDGHLWVADSRLSRFSVFDTAGTFVTTYPRRLLSWGYWWQGGFLDSGVLYDYTGAGEIGSIEPALTAFDTTGSLADTVSIPTYPAAFVRFEYTGGSTVMGIPFKEALHWTLDPRGYLWLGVSNQYRIHQTSLAGDTLRTVQRAATPPPVQSAERDSAMAALRRAARGGPVNVTIPEHKPFFVKLDVDDQGYVWVRPPTTAGDQGVPFDVFDPEGRFLGTLRADLHIPSYAPVWIRGNALYAMHQDELDVPYVARLRIEGR